MQRTTRRWATGSAAVLGAGVLLVGPVSALAQTDDDGTTTTIETPTDSAADEVRAPGEWLQGVLDALVADGTLTQAQADTVAQRLEAARPIIEHGPGPGPSGWGEGGGPGGRHGGPGAGGGLRVEMSEVATALGITEDDLHTALHDGQTLAAIAEANGKDAQTVIDLLVADAKERLDTAVTDGRIDQATADERLATQTERITDMVNNGRPARPDRTTSPDDTATTAPGTATRPTTTD